MHSDFPRVLGLLRKEKGLSQKEAAEALGVSQALLSHYEKGIRECGLEFLIKAADFYGVSADYLLGRSADPDGLTLRPEDIPENDPSARDSSSTRIGVLPMLNKKLLSNSLNIIFDLLAKSESKELTKTVSGYLMLSVYRMFRIIYGFCPKNNMNMFSVKDPGALENADAVMKMDEMKAKRLYDDDGVNSVALSMSGDSLQKTYPLFATSLFNLIKNCEDSLEK